MSNISEKFYFGEISVPPESYVAIVPTGVNEKSRLMRCLAAELKLPDYFSSNWDSLEECLSDLEWISCSIVWLKHGDMPLLADETEARIYLDILSAACRRLSDANEKQLRVEFPIAYHKTVERLLERPS